MVLHIFFNFERRNSIMATRVERTGIEGCVKKIKSAVKELNSAAKTIDDHLLQNPGFNIHTTGNSLSFSTYPSNAKNKATNGSALQSKVGVNKP